jgi:hypothetical protein
LTASRSCAGGHSRRRELTDALLCTEGPVRALVGLCLAPERRCGYGALYDPLNRGTGLPVQRMFGGRIVLAVDATAWLRQDAETSRRAGARTYVASHRCRCLRSGL